MFTYGLFSYLCLSGGWHQLHFYSVLFYRNLFSGRAAKEGKAKSSDESADVDDRSMAPAASPGASAAERVFKEASEKRIVVVYTDRDAELQKACPICLRCFIFCWSAVKSSNIEVMFLWCYCSENIFKWGHTVGGIILKSRYDERDGSLEKWKGWSDVLFCKVFVMLTR